MDDARDVADSLCAQAREVFRQPSRRIEQRLATCVFGVLLEAARSYAKVPALHDVARSMVVGPGRAASLGKARGSAEQAATTNAMLAHALLRDDSYRTALHPGQLVVPVAFAIGQEMDADGAAVLAAAGIGYEVACRFADHLLPDMANRGWRASAVVAPVAAAAAAISVLCPGDATALVAAVRLGATAVGGPLHTIAEGDDWQLQPALLVGAGIAAARMAAGGRGAARGHLEGVHGVFDQLRGDLAARPVANGCRLEQITFKSHAGPMFAQALLRAVDELSGRLLTEPSSMVATMAPFAVGYAGGSQSDSSVVSIERIVRDRLAELARGGAHPELKFTLRADPDVTDLDVVIEVSSDRGESRVRRLHRGDTTSWALDDLLRTVEPAPAAEALAVAVVELAKAPDVEAVVDLWDALAEELAGAAAGEPATSDVT